MNFALLLAILLSAPVRLQQNGPELETVLQRATQYVTQYEEELGNLIGSEEYVQNAAWLFNTVRGTTQVGQRLARRTSSDFLIIQVGPEWAALRKVNRVDGSKVKDVEPAFEDAFDDSADSNRKRLEQMKADSTRYNIGDIIRDINLPTFALKVLRKTEASRFSFQRTGDDKIEGVKTWAIHFQE